MTTKALLGGGLETFKAVLTIYLNINGSQWTQIENNLHSALNASIDCKSVIDEIVGDMKTKLEHHQSVSVRFLQDLKINKTTLHQFHKCITNAIQDEENEALELIKEIEAI